MEAGEGWKTLLEAGGGKRTQKVGGGWRRIKEYKLQTYFCTDKYSTMG